MGVAKVEENNNNREAKNFIVGKRRVNRVATAVRDQVLTSFAVTILRYNARYVFGQVDERRQNTSLI